jgi:transposase
MKTQGTNFSYSGETIYVGIDTHKKDWRVALYTDDIALKTFQQVPVPDRLVTHLRKNYPGASYRCAYEAGFGGFWIQKALASKGIDCIVVNPADIPTTNKEKEFKTDPRDCRKIAKSLRNNMLTPIYIHSDQNLACRNVVRLCNDVVKNQTRFKNKIKGLINFYGVQIPDRFTGGQRHWSKSFDQWLLQLELNCAENTWAFRYYVEEYLRVKEQVKQVKKKVTELSKTPAYIKQVTLLTSIPGIARLTAMIILTELGDIKRFQDLDQLCGYIGLVPTTKSSGEKEVIGEMTNRGNNHLKKAIIESAWSSIRHDSSMTHKYLKLIKRMDGNKAIVRIAKGLVARIMFVLIKEQEYQIINNE